MGPFGISTGDWIALAAIVISILGFVGQWYLLGFRVKLIEKWIAEYQMDSKVRNKEFATLTEVGVKLTVLNEQMERRIRILEELVIQQRNQR